MSWEDLGKLFVLALGGSGLMIASIYVITQLV